MKLKIYLLIIFISLFSASLFAINNESNFSQTLFIEKIEINNSIKKIELEINPYENIDKEIKLKNKKFIFEKGISNDLKNKLNSNSKKYILVMFNRNPSKEEIKELEKNGLKILEYIDSNLYYVKISKKFDYLFEIKDGNLKLKLSNIEDKYLINGIIEIENDYKISTHILNNRIAKWSLDNKGFIYLKVQFYNDLNLLDMKDILKSNGFEIISQNNILNLLYVKLKVSELNILYSFEEIKWIEELPKKPSFEMNNVRALIGVNELHNISVYNLNGNNIKIMMLENSVPDNKSGLKHPDLDGRIEYELFSEVRSEGRLHATLVAGILIGNGTNDSRYIGVAPKATIWADSTDNNLAYNDTGDRFLDDGLIEHFDEAQEENVNPISQNSWGFGLKDDLDSNFNRSTLCPRYGDYTLNSELMDKIVINNASLLYSMSVVFSVGNERNLLANPCNGTGGNYNLNYPYKTIPTPHTAKNIITVGGVDSKGNYICDFSSYGPTDEERIKPELVSFGCEDMDDFVITSTKLGGGYGGFEGTSFAAPHVSGTIALMLEQWNKSGYTQDPLPSTIKALLLDSTTDLKQDGSGTQTIDGPDYINGFGLLNAKGAVDRIINGTFVEANLSEENNIDIYSLNITSQNQIKVTLVWDDVPGANLINDLDLKLISPSGTIFYPWVLNPDIPNASATRNNVSNLKDNVNNVEQVYINESEIETGEWLLVISATSLISYQKYSVVSEEELFTPLKFSLIDMFPFKTNGKNLIGNIDFQVSNITFNGSEGLFDGTSNYGSTESINFLPSTGSLSVWFKSDNINNNGIILGNTKIGTQDYFRIRERSGSSKYELIIGGESFVDTSSTRDNNWHNIILTWSPSDTWKYYFDGVNLHNGSSGKVPTSIYKTFPGVLNNGNVIYGPAPNYFYGSIKDIDLYEQVLSATDIQNLYTYETPSSTPQLKDEFKSLLFYYELNDNGTDFLTGLNLSISGVNFTGSNTDFDGINDYMKTSLGNGLENSGTLSVWFKSDNLSKDGIILGNTKIGYSDYLRIRERTGSYNYEIIISDEVYLDTSSTRDTNWHNIVLTWNSSNSWKYYFDNSLVHTGSSGEIPTSPYNIFYGVLNDGDSIYGPAPNYFDGQIRDVSIFAKQFSSSDLSLLYSVDSYSDLYE